MTGAPVFRHFRALGTVAVVGTTIRARAEAVLAAATAEIEACDLACSRFRGDSELAQLNDPQRATSRQDASEWLCDALATALYAAGRTDGLVDPTIGQCLVDLGYDRSFEHLDATGPIVMKGRHVPAWQRIHVDRRRRRIHVPTGVRLDLGATAKALCADRAACSAMRAGGGAGVLVSLGGDIAVAGGPPDEGWIVRVTDRAETPPDAPVPGQTVAIREGGLATSGTAARRWARGGIEHHHLLDPRTGASAATPWKTVTVTASTCVDANLASTAAVVLGHAGPAWLAERQLSARLVDTTGRLTMVGGWPPNEEAVAS
jgi:thiamine biosynthesis lipoprotein